MFPFTRSFAASRHGILLTSGINSLGNVRCVPAELQWDRVFLSVHLLWREALQSWVFLHFATCKSLTMAAPACVEEGNSKSLFSGPLSYSSNSHLSGNMNWDNRHQKKKSSAQKVKYFLFPGSTLTWFIHCYFILILMQRDLVNQV